MNEIVDDTRLSFAHAALAGGKIRVLSVDVFDTLVWRRVPEPADIFLMLGLDLAARGKLAEDVAPAVFADIRRAAERTAREKAEAATGFREIRLADIYAEIPASLFAQDFSRAAQVAAELACESNALIVDDAVAALMQAAKTAGAQVILVSDTYLTADQLRALLAARDDLAVDRIYVSSEAGRPKYRDLFDVILADLAVAAGEMLHVGDTMEADIAPCAGRGITAVHYDKTGLPARVRKDFPRAGASRALALTGGGDFGLTGLRSRLIHRAPAHLPPHLLPYWRTGAGTLAPIFAGFARWIVGRCAARATRTILGIMREGRFLARLVNDTAQALNTALEAKEIWLSRRAVIGASLYADDLSQLTDFIIVAPGETVDEVLEALGLTLADVAAVMSGFDMRLPGALEALAHAITVVPYLKDKVVARSARNRRNLLRGLGAQINLDKAQTVTLMDLGYAATIQTLLSRILAREGAKVRLEGLYFILNDRAARHRRAHTEITAYLSEDGFASPLGRLLTRTPDVLEHACMCRDGSLDRYDDHGRPVLLPNLRGDAQLAQMEAMQDGIRAGVQAANRMLGGLDRTPFAAPALKGQIGRMLEGLMLHPTAEETETIGAWEHEANLDITDRRRLTDLAFDPSTLEYKGLAALADVGREHTYWPAAAFARVSPFLAEAYAAQGELDPVLLTSGPLLGALTVTPDLGNGFDEGRSQAAPLAVNAFGRGEITLTLKPFGPDSCARVKLAWPSAQAVIAIIPPVFTCKGERETKALAVNGLSWSGANEIFQGVQLTTGDAEAIVDLGRAPSFPHAIEMTVRFKYLRLSPIFGMQ